MTGSPGVRFRSSTGQTPDFSPKIAIFDDRRCRFSSPYMYGSVRPTIALTSTKSTFARFFPPQNFTRRATPASRFPLAILRSVRLSATRHITYLIMPLSRQIDEQFLTTSDVARALGISNQHVHRLVVTNQLPVAIRAANGFRLFKRSAIQRVADEREATPPRRGPRPGTGGRPPKKRRGKTTQ